MTHRVPLLLLTSCVALTACQTISNVGSSISSGMTSVTGWAPTFLRPYRPDVHQGNIVTKEMVEQLRQGMTREQVRFMLGTPLLLADILILGPDARKKPRQAPRQPEKAPDILTPAPGQPSN